MRRIIDDDSAYAAVAYQDIRSSSEKEVRHAAGPDRGDGPNEFLHRPRLVEQVCCTANPECGVRGEFDLPHTIAIDSQGRLFVGDRSNARIQIFDQDGNFLKAWDQFGMVSGIYISADDTLYVADDQQHKALLVGSARDGSITSRIEPVNAEGIMVDRHGNIFAGEVAGNMLRKFAKN